MLPTLNAGQIVISFNWFFKLKKGDLVVIRSGRKEIIKRVDKVSKRVVYVLGDNRDGSTDSRVLGWIDKKMIVGKVVLY